MFPCIFSAIQMYSPLSVMSAVKVKILELLECGQDEQWSGIDQLYTGSGSDDTVQFSITSSLTFTVTNWSDMDTNVGGP